MKKKLNLVFHISLVVLSILFFFGLISTLFCSENWKGEFQQIDPDSLLFARLLEQSLLKGRIIDVDNYGAFPYEVETGFAPFYLKFLFYFVNFVYACSPNITTDPMLIAGCLPVVILWLTAIMILYSFYIITENKILTLFAAFGMLPGYSWIMTGGFYSFDYDYVISFYIWTWIILCALYIKYKKHIFAYAGSFIVFLFVSTWLGCPLFYGIATLYGFITWYFAKEEKASYLEYASMSMLIGGMVAAGFCFADSEALAIQVGRYSYLQGSVVAFGGLFLVLLQKLPDTRKSRYVGLVGFVLSCIALFLIKPEFFYQATGILFKRDPVHKNISELSSILVVDGFLTSKSLEFFYICLGPILLFFPLFLFANWSDTDKKGFKLIRDWLFVFIFMAIYQVRYIRWSGCGWGLITGLVLYILWNFIKAGLSSVKFSLAKSAMVLLPVMLFTCTANFLSIEEKSNFNKSMLDSLIWLREKTEKTSGYYDDNTPEYGVLADWDNGNYVSFYAKRPAVVSNSLWGYRTMAEIFSAKNEQEAFELCKKYKVKYLLMEPTSDITPEVFSYWQLLKNTPETPIYKLYYKEVPVIEDADKCFYTYLNEKLALTPLGDFESGTRFRVVQASETSSKRISKHLIFERVEGAIAEFNLKPHTKIELSIQISLSDISFLYKRRFETDEKGYCEIRLPYSTSYNDGNVVVDDFYKIGFEDKEGNKHFASLTVPNENVVEGSVIDFEKNLNYSPILR